MLALQFHPLGGARIDLVLGYCFNFLVQVRSKICTARSLPTESYSSIIQNAAVGFYFYIMAVRQCEDIFELRSGV